MTQQEQNLLNRINVTLMEISTKGQDTILMSECLKAIGSMLSAPVEVEAEQEE